ncbi:hypothetical protein [uncultured Tateyamaria sp.]|uniref:hypothetical protein n=1 Tax=uncultured Tateyamaria sp. TaxID=455651 RepID=UPI00263223D3|nr:hypothetical protein [uncultured Tateyamaria sp.]
MILLSFMIAAGLTAGAILPLRWGVWGFVGAAAVLFLAQALVNTATGFEGIPISESLLLFNDSYLSYVGFNLQITYRAFALPLLALAIPFIFRLARSHT